MKSMLQESAKINILNFSFRKLQIFRRESNKEYFQLTSTCSRVRDTWLLHSLHITEACEIESRLENWKDRLTKFESKRTKSAFLQILFFDASILKTAVNCFVFFCQNWFKSAHSSICTYTLPFSSSDYGVKKLFCFRRNFFLLPRIIKLSSIENIIFTDFLLL